MALFMKCESRHLLPKRMNLPKSASSAESRKVDFEKSLWKNHSVSPEYYQELGNGVYPVQVKIDGKTVSYAAVDPAAISPADPTLTSGFI